MRLTLVGLLSVVAGLMDSGAASAAGLPGTPNAALDPAAAQAWGDSIFRRLMTDTHVPGGVLVIVDHGRTVVLEGYGSTTPVSGEAVDADRTLFRLGSITKVLTAIVATQMIEEGAIEPSADVNRYLKRVQVPATYTEPVTIANLLSHQGGFAADLRGVDAPTAAGADISPSEAQRLLVPRVRPPGRYVAYDNNGWGVLGLALADTAGVSYRELVTQRIFRPLGMSHSAIGLPERAGHPQVEEHYVMPDGVAMRIDHSFLKPMEQGAGDVSSSGADMARLMIALLQGGELDGQRILSPAGFRQLTDFDAHRIHPVLPGLGRAIYEDRPGGHYAMRHDGGMRGSFASMELYPEEQIGVFCAINARPYNPFDEERLSGIARGIRMFVFDPKPKVAPADFLRFLRIHEDFAARFLRPSVPRPAAGPKGPLWSDAEIAPFAGKYVATQSEFAAFSGQLQVALLEGTAVASDGKGGVVISGKPFRQVEAGLFEDPQTGARQAFRKTQAGAFKGSSGEWIDRRVGQYETPVITVLPLLVLPLFLACAGFYCLGKRRLYRRLGGIVAILGSLYAVCLLLEGEYANQVLIQDRLWLATIWRGVLQGVLLGLFVWPYWLARGWLPQPADRSVRSGAAAAHFGLLALASWALVALAGYWKLIG